MGVTSNYLRTLAMPGRREIEVVGSEAFLRIREPWHPTARGIELWQDGASEPRMISVPEADSYACEVDDPSAAVRGVHAPLLGRDDARGQARTLEALFASAASGRSVVL